MKLVYFNYLLEKVHIEFYRELTNKIPVLLIRHMLILCICYLYFVVTVTILLCDVSLCYVHCNG